MDLQHLNVKIFTSRNAFDLAEAIPVFQRWIQDSVCEELLIDVADYRHVPGGPGVLLAAHEAHYSLDTGGLLYNRKAVVEGSGEVSEAHDRQRTRVATHYDRVCFDI